MGDQNPPSDTPITQVSYKETDYADASYELIGEISENQDFIPDDFEVIVRPAQTVDPMFQDFGGGIASSVGKRWHNAQTQAVRSTNAGVGGQEITDRDGLRVTKSEIEAIKKEAFEAGRASSAEEAKATADGRMKVLEGRVSQVFTDLRMQLNGVVASLENSAVKLALDVSQKIIGFAVEINPEYLTQVLRDAFKQVGTAAIRKIRVSPEDMEFIEVVGLEKQLKEHDGSWKFEKDETIRSGCVVETSAGEIDYQLDRAWERVKNNIIKAVR